MNEQALAQMKPEPEKKLVLVPGATHAFEEPGTLEQAARLARQWFRRHLTSGTEVA
jgi:putative phosphoribosyl transferase